MADRIFVSYSNKDRAYVFQLIALMRDTGMQPWIFEHDQVPSLEYIPQLCGIIAEARAVLVVMSEHSMNSVAVLQEIHEALAVRKRIIPLQLDDNEGSATFLLRPFHWIDARHERFPVNQIARALTVSDAPHMPVIRLDALEAFTRFVRPSDAEVQLPIHSWARLQDGRTSEETICTIGAAPDRHVTIHPSLTSVSRNHAYITVRYDVTAGWFFWLYDTSKNGTYVNDQAVQGAHELHNNDLITLALNAVIVRFSHFGRHTTMGEGQPLR
jgi:hypothetical protein